MCSLHPSEIQRLLGWLHCYPVVGREDERKSLEALLKQSLELSEYCAKCPQCGQPKAYPGMKCYGDENAFHRSLSNV